MAFKIVFLALDETLEVLISLIHVFRNVSMNICAHYYKKKFNISLLFVSISFTGVFVKTT